MEVPRRYLDRYTDALDAIAGQAKSALADALHAIDYGADPARVRELVLAAAQQACGAAAETSARTAAAFYDGMRSYVTGDPFGAASHSGRVPAATEGAVRAFLKRLFEDGDTDEFERLCMERVDYEVRRAAGECVQHNVSRDRYGDTRYARVPTGPETCGFCLMLASRGPVYHTPETAGLYDHYHAHCDCRIVPIWGTFSVGPSRRAGAVSIEGYDPDELYEQYLDRATRDAHFRDNMARAAERAHARHGRTKSEGRGRRSDSPIRLELYIRDLYSATTLEEVNEVMRRARAALAADGRMRQSDWDRLWDTFIAITNDYYQDLYM